MIFEPIVYSLKHCFGSFSRNDTPKSDPLFGEEKYSSVSINVTRVRTSGIGISQRHSKVLGNKGRGSFHSESSTFKHDLSSHRKLKSSVYSSPDNRIKLHPAHRRSDAFAGKSFGS